MQLSELLFGNAILIAVGAFLVRIFGKIEAEFKPIADDKSWQAEFSGILFLISNVLMPGSAAALLLYWWQPHAHPIAGLCVLFLIQMFNLVEITKKYAEKYKVNLFALAVKVNQADVEKFKNDKSDWAESMRDAWNLIFKSAVIFSYVPIRIVAFLILLVAGMQIINTDIHTPSVFWASALILDAFVTLIGLAICKSLRQNHGYPKADIYLDTGEKFSAVDLRSVGPEQVSILQDKSLIVINRAKVVKIVISPEINQQSQVQPHGTI